MKRILTLKEWRMLLDITQEEMAQKLGIHPNTYRRYEIHPEEIRIGTVIRICDVLGIKTSELKIFP